MLARSLCTDAPSPSEKIWIFLREGRRLYTGLAGPGHENFRAPGEHSFSLILPSENVHWKCTCAAH